MFLGIVKKRLNFNELPHICGSITLTGSLPITFARCRAHRREWTKTRPRLCVIPTTIATLQKTATPEAAVVKLASYR
jgi:hypothetical protein